MEEKEDLNVTFIYQDTIARSDNFMYEYVDRSGSGSGKKRYRRDSGHPEYDFSNGKGDAEFKDGWLGLKKVPFIGHVKVGHMKEPFSIEASTSGNHLTFMERGLPNAFLGDGRNTGIMFHNPAIENRMT